jgi:hypothetical protein
MTNSVGDINHLDDDLIEEDVPDDRPDSALVRPYDSRLIRVEPKMFSLRNIMDMIDEGDLDLAPDFQRLRVWKPWQKSRLIESVLLRIPLPAFYFASDDEGRLQVVDGVQRLSTIYDYVRGTERRFKLTELEYLSEEAENKTYEDLASSVWAKRINSTQIIANVIDPQTPMRVKFDIFKRINTGGTPLNAQEIRHCMSGAGSRSFLMTLSQSKEFNLASGGKLRDHVRMQDRELILRVVAFQVNGMDGFLKTRSLDDFLNETTQQLDDADGHFRDAAAETFLASMELAYQIFHERAFRKWPAGQEKLFPINKAIFEALATALKGKDRVSVMARSDEIVSRFRLLCSNDPVFIRSVSQSTSDAVNVSERHAKLNQILDI